MASSKDYEIEMIVEEDEVMMSQSQCVPDGERCGRSDGLGNPLPGGSYIGPGCYRGIWADSHRVGWSAKHDIWVKRSDVCCDGYAMGEPNFRSSVEERYYYCKVNGCWQRKCLILLFPRFCAIYSSHKLKCFFLQAAKGVANMVHFIIRGVTKKEGMAMNGQVAARARFNDRVHPAGFMTIMNVLK